jgi:hypothetical protein
MSNFLRDRRRRTDRCFRAAERQRRAMARQQAGGDGAAVAPRGPEVAADLRWSGLHNAPRRPQIGIGETVTVAQRDGVPGEG